MSTTTNVHGRKAPTVKVRVDLSDPITIDFEFEGDPNNWHSRHVTTGFVGKMDAAGWRGFAASCEDAKNAAIVKAEALEPQEEA